MASAAARRDQIVKENAGKPNLDGQDTELGDYVPKESKR